MTSPLNGQQPQPPQQPVNVFDASAGLLLGALAEMEAAVATSPDHAPPPLGLRIALGHALADLGHSLVIRDQFQIMQQAMAAQGQAQMAQIGEQLKHGLLGPDGRLR